MEALNYKIHLAPDLTHFNFTAHTEIEIALDGPTREITLDANGLTFQRCSLRQGDETFESHFTVDPDRQAVTVHLPKAMDGEVTLTFDYTGILNDMLAGFYRSKYEHDGEAKYIAITQFEEREARRAFPCFDHPAKKATFDVEFLIDEHLTGISNTPIAEEVAQGEGKKLVRFERTPKMSTYLLFFGVGEFEFIEDDSSRTLIRVAATPGKVQYADFALQMGRKALDFGETYTGIDFPIAKCDHIAVQDFAFGAMENYGAIAYRENLLLAYPGITSKANLIDIATVIAHETSHMWFGDLVSPAEWKYLWLNESFATYFTTVITDHYYPAWQLWDDFVIETTLPGMERDSFAHTVPIELPGEQVAQIDASSAPLIYNKGAAIIRMLAVYLGEEKLKDGINYFLNRFKFDSATSQDYWVAFEEATGEPVQQFAESWIYQPGYPIVTARLEGDALTLAQQRFTFSVQESDQLWMIPISVDFYLDDGRVERRDALLDGARLTLPVPAGVRAFKLNVGQTGFYRVAYEQAMLDRLGEMIQAGELSAVDSFGVENDLFARVRRGDYALDDYLNFVERYLGQETRYLPLLDMTHNLMRLHQLSARRRARVSQMGRQVLGHALQLLGLTPADDEAVQTAKLREALLWPAFVFASEAVQAFGETQFEALLEGADVHADVLSGVLRIGAATDERAPAYLLDKVQSADTSETEKRTVLYALACFQEEDKLRQALAWNLDIISKKNRAYLLGDIARNPVAVTFLWPWFLEHFDELRQLHPLHLRRAIASMVPPSGVGREDEVEAFLAQLVEEDETALPVVNLTLDRLALYARLERI
ncbi:MAG TPA: M1 family peptidase [Chloroflexi bacterium]|nr:M1 family peptidase [Chloroflexota bacterium]